MGDNPEKAKKRSLVPHGGREIEAQMAELNEIEEARNAIAKVLREAYVEKYGTEPSASGSRDLMHMIKRKRMKVKRQTARSAGWLRGLVRMLRSRRTMPARGSRRKGYLCPKPRHLQCTKGGASLDQL